MQIGGGETKCLLQLSNKKVTLKHTWRARRLTLRDIATADQTSPLIELQAGPLKDVTGSTTISPSRSHLPIEKIYTIIISF